MRMHTLSMLEKMLFMKHQKAAGALVRLKGITPFKGAIAGMEGSFSFITFMDLNKVVGVLQIVFGIHGGLLWAIKEVRDTQKQISVFLCDFAKASKVGTETERAIFLLSKGDQSTMR